MRALLPLLVLAATPALAQPAITDGQVRAFVSAQEKAWNAGALDRFFASFTPDARFTDQAYAGDKPPVPYGTSNRNQALSQAARSRRRTTPYEDGQVTKIQIAAGGQSAQVVTRVAITIHSSGNIRHLCAYRGQALVLRAGRLLSNGHTDTFFKCASR